MLCVNKFFQSQPLNPSAVTHMVDVVYYTQEQLATPWVPLQCTVLICKRAVRVLACKYAAVPVILAQ